MKIEREKIFQECSVYCLTEAQGVSSIRLTILYCTIFLILTMVFVVHWIGNGWLFLLSCTEINSKRTAKLF